MSGSVIQLWDVASGRKLRELAGSVGIVTSLAYSPDGTTVAAGYGDAAKSVQLWLATGEARFSIGNPAAGISAGAVVAVAFSGDSRTLAYLAVDSLCVFDLVGRRRVATLDLPAGTHGLAFSPDGKTIALALADDTVKLWRVGTSQAEVELKTTTGFVNCLAFSPDGKRIASGGADGAVRLWDAASGEPIGSPVTDITDGVVSVAFSPDGRLIAGGGRADAGSARHTVVIWKAP